MGSGRGARTTATSTDWTVTGEVQVISVKVVAGKHSSWIVDGQDVDLLLRESSCLESVHELGSNEVEPATPVNLVKAVAPHVLSNEKPVDMAFGNEGQ